MFDPTRERYKLARTEEGRRKEGMETMMAFASEESVCRRRLLSRYFDTTEMECSYVSCEPCDICHNSEQSLGEDDVRVWQLEEILAAARLGSLNIAIASEEQVAESPSDVSYGHEPTFKRVPFGTSGCLLCQEIIKDMHSLPHCIWQSPGACCPLLSYNGTPLFPMFR